MTQDPPAGAATAAFDIGALALTLPRDEQRLITDLRLVDRPEAGLRLFRANGPVPRHLHRLSDEYLLVVEGRAEFEIADEPMREVGPGQLVFFERGVWHGFPRLIEEPFVVLAFEVPARDPTDVVFADGTERPFIATVSDVR